MNALDPAPDTAAFDCPRCGTPTARIVQGRELELVALEYEETAER